MITTIQSFYKVRSNNIHRFKPKISIELEVGPYLLKTANEVSELRAALELRYQIFHREMQGKTKVRGIDVDHYDFYCDHLIIIDKKTQDIVGTYRLNSSEFSSSFYSENEFDLDKILTHPGPHLELGRACIHKDFRRGIIISLLWKGIGEYMVKSNSQLLFGCATVNTQNPRTAALLYRYLQTENRMASEYSATPTAKYTMPDLDLWLNYFKNPLTPTELEEAKNILPPLFRAYLKMGAFVGGEPAWDEAFNCIDFLVVLHKNDISHLVWKKFSPNSQISIEP